MPRAKLEELRGFVTTSTVAELLGLSPYLVKSRIANGTLPPASRVSGAGVQLFDDDWIEHARETVVDLSVRQRKRKATASKSVAKPATVLNHQAGEDRWIPTWDEITTYFEELSRSSDRIVVEELGTSTDGKPYIAVFVSAAENLMPTALRRNRQSLDSLWDPRDVSTDVEARIVNEARTVGVILASQHSDEFGSALMTMQLAHELADTNNPQLLSILTNTITVLIPSHNPDGIQLISDWYRRWLGTEYEGCDLPFLYHPFVGHDNNRDWFMQTQAETRLFVDLHNREHPQAVFDMHQMGRFGPRFMVPPFIDPLDPNQDPMIQQGFSALGSHVARRMTAQARAGVVTNAMFDNYSPSLAYGNYHGSVDLLSEAASAKLATPLVIKAKELKQEDDFDPQVRTWNHPLPWKGGRWGVKDIVSYNLSAAYAFLEHLATNREQWLEDYAAINRRTCRRDEAPYAWAIPREQRDPLATNELLQTLQRGLVTIHEASRDVVADDITFPAGTRFVLLDQPAGAFAKTLLEIQDYPDLRKWPGGPPRRPYDIAGHTLSLQMGVNTVQIDQPLPSTDELQPIDPLEHLTGTVAIRVSTDGETRGWAIDARSNAAIRVLVQLLDTEIPVYRARARDRTLGVGTGDLVIRAADIDEQELRGIVEAAGATAVAIPDLTGLRTWRQDPVRVGIYQPWTASIDEGWARWVLTEYGVPFTTLCHREIRQGGLLEKFDVILLPEMTPRDLVEGRPAKNAQDEPFPPEYVGGLGAAGFGQLRDFVDGGGAVVAIDRSARAVIEEFALPISNPLRNRSIDEFYCPGSLLRVVVDNEHPLGLGLPRETTVLFMQSMVFKGTGSTYSMPAKYASTNPSLSGWILGAEHLAPHGALAEVDYGDGLIVLFGFRPYFRAQTRGTYRLFFNALFRAGLFDEEIDA